jgi:hypothetical protein
MEALARWVAWHSTPTITPLRTDFTLPEAKQLLEQLQAPRSAPEACATFASLEFMREYRRRFCGAALELLARYDVADIHLYTLIPRGWSYPGRILSRVDPKSLLARLRGQLTRAGLSRHGGWMTAYIHGEYDGVADLFRLHAHVLAVGGKEHAIEALRKLQRFQQSAELARPIQETPLRDRIRQITYFLAQAYWPEKDSIADQGRVSVRGHPRIKGDRLAEFLMFIARQSFEDLTWLHGVQLRGGLLVPGGKHAAPKGLIFEYAQSFPGFPGFPAGIRPSPR